MATGPEHYKQAESYLIYAGEAEAGVPANEALLFAQVHATLAQVAATVDAAYGEMSIAASDAWAAVLGEESDQ